MYQANVKLHDESFVLVLKQDNCSDAIPLSRAELELLLVRAEDALNGIFEGSLSKGDFYRFIDLGHKNHFLLSINVEGFVYRGYDLDTTQLKLLKASIRNAINKADTSG